MGYRILNVNTSSYHSSSLLNFKTNLDDRLGLKNSRDTEGGTGSSGKILGYRVDKDGYFTSEFNKAAGIPEDIKIHSSTMENLVREETTTDDYPFRAFKSVNIAKTVGNTYKVVSQLVDKNPELKGKTNFSREDLEQRFAQGYLINKDTLEVKQLFSYDEIRKIQKEGKEY